MIANLRKLIVGVLLLHAGFANAAVTNLFPNGNFDAPAGTNAPWLEVFGGGTTTYSYPTSGGNPNGYGVMTNASGWGIWVGQLSPTAGYALAPLGLVAGGNYNFVMDMKNFSGTSIGKLKIECWAGGTRIDEGPEILAGGQSGSWATYTFNRTLVPGTTDIMIVPVAGAGSAIGYDNIGVVVTNTLLSVSITSPVNGATVTSNFTITATATVNPGTVTNVAFYDGATLLGNDATSPYSYAVSNATLGAHALKAVARDGSGNSATSSIVNVTVSNPPPAVAGWQLVWSDEFDGSSVDTSKWVFESGTGSGGWGNNERQFYTSRTNNASVAGGVLRIIARQEVTNGSPYTSARMKTQGRYSKKYGRIEFRSKLPVGVGCWPANWMMPETSAYGGWASSGEIDVMESRGSDPTRVEGTIHYGGTWPNNVYTGAPYIFPNGGLATNFHTYMVEWSTNSLKWFVDGVLYQTQTNWYSAGGPYPAPFDQAFYLILNLAIGGNYLGNPSDAAINAGTAFPVEMQVDYVRVYDYVPGPPATPTGLSASPGNAKAYLSWDDSNSAGTVYRVKRATTSGGPYTTIATVGANNYTDNTVANCSTYYYVVAATNSLGATPDSDEVQVSLGAFALAVNSGGGAVGHFTADANVAGGTIGAVSTAIIDTSGLEAPAPQAVYQAERYGNFTYTFTGLTAGTTYQVRLHSAETYWTAVGQRRFNVVINGTQILTNFDIIAAAGAPNKAMISEFNTVASGGQIVIQYTTVTDNARASGIEILLPQPVAPTASNNGPVSAGMTLSLSASTVPGATYLWTGPNGFTSTNQNPSIANVTTDAAGLFSVTATVGSCSSDAGTTLVSVSPPAMVGAEFSSGNLILIWPSGTLQSATNIFGPWMDLNGATSPLTNPATEAQEFYRLKLQ
jgi:beta-glucanase (GH16 family)